MKQQYYYHTCENITLLNVKVCYMPIGYNYVN